MSVLEQRLLNDFQRHFPLVPSPYAHLANELQVDTHRVLELLSELVSRGTISRVGPVFKPNMLGVSTLAAMSVPGDQLQTVAELVNNFPEVNHNYEREHRFNLWFVAVAADQQALAATLAAIERVSGYEVMTLPLLKEYHIDLGFNMGAKAAKKTAPVAHSNTQTASYDFDHQQDGALIGAIQAGLPLLERPYLAIAEQLGISEQQVIQKISDLLAVGIIRRLGVIVRHHELGYRANAMVVWNVPDDHVDERGKQLSAEDAVTLCYQRPRVKPAWPYNLFSMIHGKDRDAVVSCIEGMAEKLGLDNTPYEILFSLQRFKQRGAKYFAKEKALP